MSYVLLKYIQVVAVLVESGMLELKPGRPEMVWLNSSVAALLVFNYVVSVAMYRQPARLLQVSG